MKIYFYLLSFLFLSSVSTVQAQVINTGADAFGYRFFTSANATTPATYEWVDISSTGTKVTGLGDDNIIGPFPLGIDFKYYWNTYNSCYIGSNGYIMFGDNSLIAQSGTGMPTIPFQGDGKGNFIAPFLSDLTFISHATGQQLPGAKVLYQTIDSKFIITYDSVRFWNNGVGSDDAEATGMNSFQVILDAATNNIQINYKISVGPWFTGSAGVLTQGMENVNGGMGLRWRRKAATTIPLPPALSAVKVNYPLSSTYTFKDVQAKAIFTFDNKGGTAFKGIPKTITAYVRNAGTVKVKTPITARIIVSDYYDNAIYNKTVLIDSLQQGEEKILNFPDPLLPGDTAGSFKVRLNTSTTGDAYSGNNEKYTKLVVLDSTQGSVDLKFTAATPGTLTNTSQSPNSGMVFDPPYQPMVISKISADLVWPDIDGWASVNILGVQDSLTNTRIEVYAGDGPNGAIGTLIDSFTIATSNDYEHEVVGEELSTGGAVLNSIIRFKRTLPTPFSWYNGARIYVGAVHNNKTRFVWNSPFAEVYKPGFPASGRSLELTGGVYGENRGKDSIDVALGLIGDPLAVAVNGIVKLPQISLDQNVPNPATGSTSISFSLRKEGMVSFSVKDAMGREVLKKNIIGKKGKQTILVSLEGLKPALYYYSVSHETGTATKKFIVR